MKLTTFIGCLTLCFLLMATGVQGAPASRILKHSDVVFMYQADRKTYEAYGATVLAWGGRPTPESLKAAEGITFFGSVGMVTEFARYYERFPETYEQGLCLDVHGHPVKVPWLTDHEHKGVPYWWCCTRQPQVRQYFRERVIETVRAGADGVHIDDHLGTAGGLWLGICFCDRCLEGFQKHLQSLPRQRLNQYRIDDPATFNYKEAVLAWMDGGGDQERKPAGHPLWGEWTVYQCRSAAAFMAVLRDLAQETADRTVPMGANAGLLWPRHLSDYKTLDLFSAETDHHASEKHFPDLPVVAYRMADAVGRPYAATASGRDWAFIKEANLPGLVRGWVALSYAAGHCLMAPHRQWCYTTEKGTHWYAGPQEQFAPLYRFVREQAAYLDGYENHADLAIILPHAAFLKNSRSWFDLCTSLSASNISFRLLLAGDDIVDHPLTEKDWQSCRAWLVINTEDLLPADRALVEGHLGDPKVFRSLKDAISNIRPAVQLIATGPARALPRTKPGSAVVHLLNYDYHADQDDVRSLDKVEVQFDLEALGMASASTVRLLQPAREPETLPLLEGKVTVPELGLWGLLVMETP